MVEVADYEVVRKLGMSVIRRYGSLVVAQVDDYGEGGFNLHSRFIHPNSYPQMAMRGI